MPFFEAPFVSGGPVDVEPLRGSVAGKSSIGGYLLEREGLTWFNPDAFARELKPQLDAIKKLRTRKRGRRVCVASMRRWPRA